MSEIRELRERRGLTQQELATLLGVHIDTVQRWEHGETLPQRKFRGSLARRLGVTVMELHLVE